MNERTLGDPQVDLHFVLFALDAMRLRESFPENFDFLFEIGDMLKQ